MYTCAHVHTYICVSDCLCLCILYSFLTICSCSSHNRNLYPLVFRHVYSLRRYIVFYYYLITAGSLLSVYSSCALLFVLMGGFIPEHNKFPSLSSPLPLRLPLFLPLSLSSPFPSFSLYSPDVVPCTNTAMQRDTGCESYITTTGRLLPLGSCATCMET